MSVELTMKANYHTHTPRCNHATGSEREYIEQGLKRKLEILGFADHSPQVFDDYVSGFRMRPEQLEDYVMTLRQLREEYAGRIQILIGLEAEYYPKYFPRLLDLIRPFQLDYLILGQHFLGNECEGEESGAFSCFAHPDVLNFTGENRIYRKWYEKLCVRAKELNIPLELNMLGYVETRHYPNAEFFRIANEVGNEVILGCDAHAPGRVAVPSEIEGSLRFLKDCGIEHVLETLKLKMPAP